MSSTNYYYIRVITDGGNPILIDLSTIDGVQGEGAVEIWQFNTGGTERFLIGTFQKAVAQLILENDSGPQEFRPGSHIKIQQVVAP